MSKKRKFGISGDAILLMSVKLMTVVLGIVTTRLLSEHLSIHDYGTYSQILLIVSTVTSFTILGMMDGVNYFYCSERNLQKREEYISTIFAIQFAISTVAGIIIMLFTGLICKYFENPDLAKLMIFAATVPFLQNLLSMFQILLISIGKAKMLAARNFLVSAVRLAVVFFIVVSVKNISIILVTTVLLDIAQIIFFAAIVEKSGCKIRLYSVKTALAKHILRYCIPMAVFIAVNALNRDIDKYIIALFTDTETLAVYANASKILPFDIIAASFCTVLIPKITEDIACGQEKKAAETYKIFLEISFVSTGILCFAALSAAPQFMKFLYSEKYMSGLAVFCIYIFSDLFRFMNMTLILSAAGRTAKLMMVGVLSLFANTLLNAMLFSFMGITGPAIATLAVSIGTGIVMLYFSAKELGITVKGFFDFKYALLFVSENMVAMMIFSGVQRLFEAKEIHYFLILVMICGAYCAVMALLNGKRFIGNLKKINDKTE